MKLLVNTPQGAQETIEIDTGGGYFDQTKVIWDERADGLLPEITLGGMVRNADGLVYDQSRMDQHLAALVPLISADVRAKRNQLLVSSDWTQVIDAPVDQAAWATYRQALRDISAQAGFPATVVWPTQPE